MIILDSINILAGADDSGQSSEYIYDSGAEFDTFFAHAKLDEVDASDIDDFYSDSGNT